MSGHSIQYDQFENGMARGISAVQRDSAGNLLAWIENGYKMAVQRDANGYPIGLSATGNQSSLAQTFSFDSFGRMVKTAGHQIPTHMRVELLGNALVGGTKFRTLTGAYTLSATDDGATLICTAALTITVPSTLTALPRVEVDCPSAGTVTIASDGTALLNGATTSLTRTRANNQSGFRIRPHFGDTGAPSYGVGGA